LMEVRQEDSPHGMEIKNRGESEKEWCLVMRQNPGKEGVRGFLKGGGVRTSLKKINHFLKIYGKKLTI